MTALFFYGTLCYRPLLDLVLGDAGHLRVSAARLPGHGVYWAEGQIFPVIEQGEGVAEGLLIEGVRDEDRARLDFYEAGFDYALKPVEVATEAGPRTAEVYFPEPGRWPAGAPWVLEDWVRDWGAVTLRAAEDVMACYGHLPASEVDRWFTQIRIRASSFVRARGETTPVEVRRDLGLDDVERLDTGQPYRRFFSVEEHRLRFRRFNGGMSDPVDWAAFVSGDAVTVLPYDPLRDRVLVIEQFRLGPFARGDARPWTIEPIAGRIDPGEAPEACAHREAREEAGVDLRALEQVAHYYPSPGAVSEYLYSYIAIADLPDEAARIGGQDSESEDIRGILLSFGELMDLLQSGEAQNGPLILSALWLAAQRERIRREAGQ